MKEVNTKEMLTTYYALDRAVRDASYWTRQANAYTGDSTRYSTYAAGYAADAQSLRDDLNKQIAVLEGEIKAVEGRATARTITALQVLEALRAINDRFSFASQKAREGLAVSVDLNAQKFPRAYKYTADSTQFSAVYRKGSWRIVSITRGICRAESKRYIITMPDTLKEALITEYSTNV